MLFLSFLCHIGVSTENPHEVQSSVYTNLQTEAALPFRLVGTVLKYFSSLESHFLPHDFTSCGDGGARSWRQAGVCSRRDKGGSVLAGSTPTTHHSHFRTLLIQPTPGTRRLWRWTTPSICLHTLRRYTPISSSMAFEI